ncbi:MAG: phosphogluconate dehydrogenase C-terminal domain-containing protein [Geminicoccaceae bacterium]
MEDHLQAGDPLAPRHRRGPGPARVSGLSETIGATLVTALREATDVVVAKGVPRRPPWTYARPSRHRDGILFEDFPGMFSDGAKLAIANAKPKLLRDDWLNVLEPAEIEASVKEICNPKGAAS